MFWRDDKAIKPVLAWESLYTMEMCLNSLIYSLYLQSLVNLFFIFTYARKRLNQINHTC